jgi:hypothetical protein
MLHVDPVSVRRQVSFADTLEWDYVGLRTDSAINMQLNRAALDINRHWAQRELRIAVRTAPHCPPPRNCSSAISRSRRRPGRSPPGEGVTARYGRFANRPAPDAVDHQPSDQGT